MRHLENPRALIPQSIMPMYSHLSRDPLDFAAIQKRVDAMAMLGVPYGDAVRNAPAMARAQAREVAQRIEEQGGPDDLETREMVALVAYLQRLGRDVTASTEVAKR